MKRYGREKKSHESKRVEWKRRGFVLKRADMELKGIELAKKSSEKN